MKEFYKMRLIPSEEGMAIVCDTYKVIRETECICFCVSSFNFKRLMDRKSLPGEKILDKAKRNCVRVRRINKANSRLAFPTKSEAYENLVFLKSLQKKHLERDLKLLSLSLEKVQGLNYSELHEISTSCEKYLTIIPETKDAVLDEYNFDY